GGPHRFYQPAGVDLRPYGLWRLSDANREGVLFLTEGESDCVTLWRHHLPALGFPGSNSYRCLAAEDLAGLNSETSKLYVVLDRDEAGDKFLGGLVERLTELRFRGKVYAVRLPELVDEVQVKDVSDLHVVDPDGFLAKFNQLKTQAPTPRRKKRARARR